MVTVKQVTTRKQLKQFVDFPNHLYKHNKYYIPTFFSDELNTLDPKKNFAYDYCEAKFFLAYKNNTLVGRIGVIINHAYNQKKGLKQIRFTRFDTIDDLEVTKALFSEVIRFGIEKGMEEVIGPIGFNDLDKQGMLVEGYEEESNTITLYNYPYYVNHVESLGFAKDIDWVEYQVFAPKEQSERLIRLSNVIKKRYGYKVLKLNSRKELTPYILEAFKVYNAAFSPLYGTVPIKDNQVAAVVKQFVPLINMKYLYIIMSKDDELIGFGLMIPSLNAATKKSSGRLFPLGIFRLLRALKKADVLDMYLIAVKPEYQNLGVNALILTEGLKSVIENNVKYAETGPELETNDSVQSQWKDFETRQHRRRRCYKIRISDFPELEKIK